MVCRILVFMGSVAAGTLLVLNGAHGILYQEAYAKCAYRAPEVKVLWSVHIPYTPALNLTRLP